jgi:alkylated DNA repair dioxygenase AlkB
MDTLPDLSQTPCAYRPGFLAPAAAWTLYRRLLETVDWKREQLKVFGRTLVAPRLVAWCGDAGLNYRYSGCDHRCDGWLAELVPLRRRLARCAGFASHFVLLNRYRSGADTMGWHRDDERGLGRLIASISLGAERRFLVRRAADGRAQALTLEHGSLLLLDGRTAHALPRTSRPVGERINLTFRSLPDPRR